MAGRSSLDEIARFLGTGAYSGYSPVAPGTAGTVVAVPLLVGLLALVGTSASAWIGLLIITTAVAIWSAERCSVLFELKDPGLVVSDEIAGFFVTMAFLPVTPISLVVGFFAFRFFDIVKPAPARQAEALPGGFGIVLDDLVAGVYANLTVRAVLAILAVVA
ncbi:MAG: phosphatidylglycerophosphatase A [Hyphomicrobiaceae bacterium]|jgi:phosphatidylglycerophosphatase A